MRSSRRILLAALVPLLAATAFSARGSVPEGYQAQGSSALADGVHHEALTLADPAQSVHVARVAPGAARLVAVSSHDAVARQGDGGELPSDQCRRVGCFAGITGDFRDAMTGDPAGGVVSGGRLLRSPVPGRPQLIVTRDGRLQAGPLDWSGSVTASDGRTAAIGAVNVDPRPGDVVLYTPAWGGTTPDGADTELVVRSAGAIGAIGADTPVEILGLRSEAGPIPADGAVLAATGSPSALLHEIGDLAAAGRISRTLTLRIRTAVDALESLGGNPVVLRSGQPAFADVDDSFTRGRHPRSLVGWNAAGEVLLVTVDGGRPDASGMTLAEAAGLLSGLGATEGFGFDHRSATFVAGGEVRNLPIDDVEPGAPAPTGGREIVPGHVERPAVNTFMVVPKLPDPPPAPPAGPSTKPGSGSPGKPGTGGTTAGTAPAKVTGAGGGSTAPGVAAPVVSGGSVLPGAVSDILHNPATKRAKRPTAKSGRTRRDRGGDGEDGEDVYAGDPSIPGWDDITAALTPEAVAEGGPDDELSLGAGEPGRDGPGAEVLPALLRLVAAGMITTVMWGLHRARQALRARPALWF